MNLVRTFAVFAAFAVLLSAQFKPLAHPEQPEPDPTFSIDVRLVRLLVTVKDASGAPVSTLTKDDFQVFDSGVAQTISAFERNTSLPLSVAVLIDTSASTNIELHRETASLLRFIPALLNSGNPDDAFALFSFNWRTSLEVDYSRNLKRAEHALRMLRGEGGTSMYDAICLASDTLARRGGRHVIVVVTDGGDTTSYKKFEDASRNAQESDVVVYPIVVLPIEGDAGRNLGGEHALRQLADSTGGRIFYPESFDHLDTAFNEILRELRTQYFIGFYPRQVPSQPRRFHKLQVKLNRDAFRIGTRTGYYEP